MTAPRDILRGAEARACRPWPRHVLSAPDWASLARGAADLGWALTAHWADTLEVHALLLDRQALAPVLVSTPVQGGRYPALSVAFPDACLYERMVRDLWGHSAEGAADLRPWLDHGTWPQVHPMAARFQRAAEVAPAQAADDGADPVAVVPMGPVWGLIEEAAHVRLTMDGAAIGGADSRLGFTHKGILALMRGKSARAAARFAARLSADATVAHSVAFAEATEAASDSPAPPRAAALRIVMQEIERIAGHLGNLAEVGLLADAAQVHARCSTLREVLLRATEAAFGHRLMMDCVVPGGVAADIAAGGQEALLRAMGDIARQAPAIRAMRDSARLRGIGVVSGFVAQELPLPIVSVPKSSWLGLSGPPVHARARGGDPDGTPLKPGPDHDDKEIVTPVRSSLNGFVGGVVGRACGRDFDARALFGTGYGAFGVRVAIGQGGDAAARRLVRLTEIEESLRLASTALHTMPDGKLTVALPRVSGEGVGCAESIRGDVWHWVRLDHGQVAAVFPRDPGWALWPLAQRVLKGAAMEDVDLIRASLALPASGMDL